jgi:hypothetical protein
MRVEDGHQCPSSRWHLQDMYEIVSEKCMAISQCASKLCMATSVPLFLASAGTMQNRGFEAHDNFPLRVEAVCSLVSL